MPPCATIASPYIREVTGVTIPLLPIPSKTGASGLNNVKAMSNYTGYSKFLRKYIPNLPHNPKVAYKVQYQFVPPSVRSNIVINQAEQARSIRISNYHSGFIGGLADLRPILEGLELWLSPLDDVECPTPRPLG